VLQDALFVVDDYAPRVGLDDRELQAKAARLLRAQGNLAGRGRLRPDTSERPETPPRGLILATGEQHPAGHSILARVFLIQVKRGDLNLGVLTALQRAAHLLPQAMAGYLGWIAGQMRTLPDYLHERFQAVRELAASESATHLRVPEAVAHLYIGFE